MTFRAGGHVVVPKKALKYLGVWIGREYRFGTHVTRVLERAAEKTKAISRLMPNVGGPGETARRLLNSVALAQILYVAPVWKDALRHKTYRGAAESLLRRLAIRVTAGYRTVSGPAIMVVARIPPLHHLAGERESASRLSKDEARQEMLDQWQEEWERESRGAWTRRIIPDLRPWVKRTHGEVDHWLCQMLTGHGAFGAYLYRFKRRETPDCLDCGAFDDVSHVLFACPRWEDDRARAWGELGRQPTEGDLVRVMLEGQDRWRVIAKLAKRILRKKDEEDAERMSHK